MRRCGNGQSTENKHTPSLHFVRKVLSPDGGEGSQTAGGLDVADDTADNHRRSFDDGNGLNNLLLVHLYKGIVSNERPKSS